MVKPSFFIFGYRTVRVEGDRVATLLSLFLKRGISCTPVSSEHYIISCNDFKRIRVELEGLGALISPVRGVPMLLTAAAARLSVIIAFAVSLLINLSLSGLVWDVRISGNDTVPDYVIKGALSEAGLSVGSLWSSLDRSMIETEVSATLDEIAWLNINRRGTVAYVDVVERAVLPMEESPVSTPCNIIAEFDCVIVDVDVASGTPCVIPGDVVRRGDVLISGIVEDDNGVSFVAAGGRVVGLVTDSISASASRREWIRETDGRSLVELRLNIFNFSANIFKNYGNVVDSCDIIEKNESFVVRNTYRLPFGLTKRYAVCYTDVLHEHTDAELIALTMSRHNAALALRLSDGELVRISTRGDFTEDGYSVMSDIVYSTDVGRAGEIEIKTGDLYG